MTHAPDAPSATTNDRLGSDLRGRSSPFHDLLGFVMTEWSDGHCVICCDLRPQHMNRNGFVHGGVLMAMLDEAGAAAGVWAGALGHARRSVTIDLNCSFTGRARVGRLAATGTMLSHGRQIFFCRSEVRDQDGTLIAFAQSTHRWRSEPDAS